MKVGNMHKLPPSSAGASFSSQLNLPALSATDSHRCSTQEATNLCQIWHNLDTKPIERHRFYSFVYRCAKRTFRSKIFNFTNFLDLGFHDYLLTKAHSFDILIPFVAHYGPFDALESLFTSTLCGCCCQHRCRQTLPCGEEAWHLAATALELASTALCDGTRWIWTF